MKNTASSTRRTIRRIVGSPVSSRRIPGPLPLVLDRHQALFESITLPPLPGPMLLVHTGGKPMAYRSSGGLRRRQSMPGLVTFLPPNIPSEVTLRGVGEGTVVYFDAEKALPSWLVRSAVTEPVTFINEVIVSITRRLVGELDPVARTDKYLGTLASALLTELRYELGRPRHTPDVPASRGGLRIAHAAIGHMRAHLDEPLSVKHLAGICGVGVTSFASSFRRATGVTPHRYLRKARIERSCELLRTTALYVGEVAEAVGFRGQSHFCTAFIAERGLTPSAYRRACREGRST